MEPKHRVVSSAYLNDRGAWVVNGAMGQKQYYGYTRKEAVNRYEDECKSRVFFNEQPAPVKDSTPPFSPTENKKNCGVIEYLDV